MIVTKSTLKDWGWQSLRTVPLCFGHDKIRTGTPLEPTKNWNTIKMSLETSHTPEQIDFGVAPFLFPHPSSVHWLSKPVAVMLESLGPPLKRIRLRQYFTRMPSHVVLKKEKLVNPLRWQLLSRSLRGRSIPGGWSNPSFGFLKRRLEVGVGSTDAILPEPNLMVDIAINIRVVRAVVINEGRKMPAFAARMTICRGWLWSLLKQWSIQHRTCPCCFRGSRTKVRPFFARTWSRICWWYFTLRFVGVERGTGLTAMLQ